RNEREQFVERSERRIVRALDDLGTRAGQRARDGALVRDLFFLPLAAVRDVGAQLHGVRQVRRLLEDLLEQVVRAGEVLDRETLARLLEPLEILPVDRRRVRGLVDGQRVGVAGIDLQDLRGARARGGEVPGGQRVAGGG